MKHFTVESRYFTVAKLPNEIRITTANLLIYYMTL